MAGDFKDYDITCSLGTYEVKTDLQYKRTGNVFIEHSYRGAPGGLRGTKADYFVIVLGDVAHFSQTVNWREAINKNRRAFKVVQKAGDGGKSLGILVPVGFISPSYIASLRTANLDNLNRQ